VNPSLAQVVAAVSEPVALVWREPALAGVVVAVLWVLLAAWEPTTTWHLAPFLVGAVPPWLLSRRAARLMVVSRWCAASPQSVAQRRPVSPSRCGHWGCCAALTGSGPVVVESVVLGALGPLVVVVLAARRPRKGG